MLYIIILINILVFGLYQKDTESLETITQPRLWRNKYRCTRRFSPGSCLTRIQSVWTFEFQLQNCTERLGCTNATRSNRFRSYASCMSRCQVLIDLYTYILSKQGNETETVSKEGHVNGRDDKANIQDAVKVRSFKTEDDEIFDDEPLVYKKMGNIEDMEVLRDVTVPDIDYVFGGVDIQDIDDPLHPPLY